MTGINSIYEEIKGSIHPTTAIDLLSMMTRHNRIQGSRGLWRSVRELAEILENAGLPARIERIEPGSRRGYIDAPASWDPLEASLEIKINGRKVVELDLKDHPTLLSAHTRGGEGCGEVRICGEKPCSGEAVLVTGYLYHHYLHSDAGLIIYYAGNREPDHVPYTGLFIKPGEALDKVVVNIPYSKAMNIISRKIQSPRTRIEACWRARVEFHDEGLPVLIACSGPEPRILYISHICHPKPGSHDNASGSVANALVALATVNYEGSGFCHAWVPEYTGTVHLDKWIPETVEAAVNLDMVGSKQWITGSVLSIVNPPRIFGYRMTPLLWASTWKVLNKNTSFTGFTEESIRYTIAPYGMGSDHDVLLSWGYEAPMLNEWPSKYYHTDGDRPETIDPWSLAQTAYTVLLAGELYSRLEPHSVQEIARTYESYVRAIYHLEAFSKGYPATRLSRYLVKQPVITRRPHDKIIESPIISREMYRVLGPKEFMEIRRMRYASDLLGLYLPIAESIGLDHPVERFDAEKLVGWSRSEKRRITEAWAKLKELIG